MYICTIYDIWQNSSKVVVVKLTEHLEGKVKKWNDPYGTKHSWEELCFNYIVLPLDEKMP